MRLFFISCSVSLKAHCHKVLQLTKHALYSINEYLNLPIALSIVVAHTTTSNSSRTSAINNLIRAILR